MKIVSANYHDRKSATPWLVRDESEHPDKARAFKSVVATGISFRPSSVFEQGFGCSMVAYCETVTGSNEQPSMPRSDLTRLRFGGFSFQNEAGEEVERCAKLYLQPDGSMFFLLTATADESEIMQKVRMASPLRYSPQQEGDAVLGQVSKLVLQLAATRVRLTGEYTMSMIKYGSEPNPDARNDPREEMARLKHELALVNSMYDYHLRSETSAWDGGKITLRKGGVAVITAKDAAEYELRTDALNKSTDMAIEALGGGSPPTGLPPELEIIESLLGGLDLGDGSGRGAAHHMHTRHRDRIHA